MTLLGVHLFGSVINPSALMRWLPVDSQLSALVNRPTADRGEPILRSGQKTGEPTDQSGRGVFSRFLCGDSGPPLGGEVARNRANSLFSQSALDSLCPEQTT